MAATGTFLGFDFDMTTAMSHGEVAFFVRERLVSKVSDLVASILEARTLRSGLASKLYGMLNFLELGIFGRVGAGGLQAILRRGSSNGETGRGSGGFHLVFFGTPQKRLRFVAEVNAALYQLFSWP